MSSRLFCILPTQSHTGNPRFLKVGFRLLRKVGLPTGDDPHRVGDAELFQRSQHKRSADLRPVTLRVEKQLIPVLANCSELASLSLCEPNLSLKVSAVPTQFRRTLEMPLNFGEPLQSPIRFGQQIVQFRAVGSRPRRAVKPGQRTGMVPLGEANLRSPQCQFGEQAAREQTNRE